MTMTAVPVLMFFSTVWTSMEGLWMEMMLEMRPGTAWLKYRDYWYYIDDRDQESKATFALVLGVSRLDFDRQQPGGPFLRSRSQDNPPIILDAAIRAGSNVRSGESDEAVEGEINTRPRNPGSHLDTSRRVPRRRVVFDSWGLYHSRNLTGPSWPNDGNPSEQVRP